MSYGTGDYEISVSAAIAREQAQIWLESQRKAADRKSRCKHLFLERYKSIQKISRNVAETASLRMPFEAMEVLGNGRYWVASCIL